MQSEIVSVRESFNVHAGVLWQSITEPNQMRQWFFSEITDFKPEEGFETQFDVSFDGRTFRHIWKIIEVVPGEKIVYDWSYAGYEGRAKVTFKVYASSAGSSLVIDHEIMDSFSTDEPAFSLAATKAGWEYFLSENLKEYLENG